MATAIGFDPGTWNSTVIGPFTLGQVYDFQGRLFRYFQNSATAAIADGTVCCRYSSPAIGASAASFTVIGSNRTTALAGTPAAKIVVCVGVGAVSASNYGFGLVLGIHTNVLSTSSTLGTLQKAYLTGSDQCTDGAAAGDLTFGTCLVATSGGRAVVDVMLMGR